MAGGAQIFIHGFEMAQSPSANLIKLISTNIETLDLELAGTPLSDDDVFSSSSGAGRLAYTVPSVMELFNQPYDYFSGGAYPVNGFTPVMDW